jgi:peptide/nickel transport system permease protein
VSQLIISRLAQGAVTLLVVTIVIFALSRATGNPVDLMLPPQATATERAETTRALGLDAPLPQQYAIFLGNALRGDFGKSIRSGARVTDLYLQRLPNTLLLAAASLALVIAGAVPLGVLAALHRGSLIDGGVRLITTLGIALPLFWLGLLLIEMFAVNLRLLPAGGIGTLQHLVMPAVTLGFFFLSGICRLLRASMIEVLDSDFVKMLRVKGLPERRVVLEHALRNALITPVTLLGQYTAVMLGGAVVVEVVFAWPGVGRLAYEGIQFRDFPVVQAVITINAAILIVSSLAVDILLGYLDPRIRATA